MTLMAITADLYVPFLVAREAGTTLPAEATAHYAKHPMGYACVDCKRAAAVGKAVHHASTCDIAPSQAVSPCWPTYEQLTHLDKAMANGDPNAERDAEILLGLRPMPPLANKVTVVSAAGYGPYFVQSFETGRWTNCVGQWFALSDAKKAAQNMRGVMRFSSEYRVISQMDLERPQRLQTFVLGLKTHDLERRGIIRFADTLRSGDDDELDQMWRPRSRFARRRAAAAAEREKPTRRPKPVVGMLRSLRLEFVGHDYWSIAKLKGIQPWVAEVRFGLSDWVGHDGVRATVVRDRTFMDGPCDFTESDKTGGEGVYRCFMLRQGVVYEVFDRARRTGPRRVFMLHDGQCWHDLTQQEAINVSAK